VEDKTGNAIYTLRQTYQKHLLPYEGYCQQKADPEVASQAGNKRAASPSAKNKFDAMLAAVDDAAEAAQILGNLMSFDRGGTPDDELPFKRLKTEAPDGGVIHLFCLSAAADIFRSTLQSISKPLSCC
jgi:hypothetical protein